MIIHRTPGNANVAKAWNMFATTEEYRYFKLVPASKPTSATGGKECRICASIFKKHNTLARTWVNPDGNTPLPEIVMGEHHDGPLSLTNVLSQNANVWATGDRKPSRA